MTGDCRISDMDRHTIAGTGEFVASPDDEFMENNCVDDPVRLCDFQLLENRIMKTMDSVYQDVPTMEACRDLCLTAPYRCHSFDYGDTGERVCRLSHHTSTTLTQIQVKNYFRVPITIKLPIQNQLLTYSNASL